MFGFTSGEARARFTILSVSVAALVALLGVAQSNSEQEPLASLKRAAGDVHYTKLVITGETVDKGIYDPSVAYTPDGTVGWLTYSSVIGNGNLVKGRVRLGEYVSTHLARTTDGGATCPRVSPEWPSCPRVSP